MERSGLNSRRGSLCSRVCEDPSIVTRKEVALDPSVNRRRRRQRPCTCQEPSDFISSNSSTTFPTRRERVLITLRAAKIRRRNSYAQCSRNSEEDGCMPPDLDWPSCSSRDTNGTNGRHGKLRQDESRDCPRNLSLTLCLHHRAEESDMERGAASICPSTYC